MLTNRTIERRLTPQQGYLETIHSARTGQCRCRAQRFAEMVALSRELTAEVIIEEKAARVKPKATWKWNSNAEGYLTAKGESSISPRARVYACWAAGESRYKWTVTVLGQAVAVSIDPQTAMRLARDLYEESCVAVRS